MARDLQAHIAAGVALRAQALHAPSLPVGLGLLHGSGHGQRWQGRGRTGLGGARAARGVPLQFCEVAGRVGAACAGIHGGNARRQVQRVKDHESAEGDHQVERQRQHAADVVRIQPCTLAALGGAKGEEVLEDAPVRDHAGEQRHEHQQRGHAHDPAPLQHPSALVRSAQLEMEAVEEVSPRCGPWREDVAGGGVHQQGLEALARPRVPQQRHLGLALVGQAHDPLGGLRCVLPQGGQGALGDGCRVICLGGRQGLEFGAHPVVELGLEIRQRARHEDGKQQPAQQQPRPGVQPGHGLAKALACGGAGCIGGRAHAAPASHCGTWAASPSSIAGPSTPHQACQAVRAKKTQAMANA